MIELKRRKAVEIRILYFNDNDEIEFYFDFYTVVEEIVLNREYIADCYNSLTGKLINKDRFIWSVIKIIK